MQRQRCLDGEDGGRFLIRKRALVRLLAPVAGRYSRRMNVFARASPWRAQRKPRALVLPPPGYSRYVGFAGQARRWQPPG